MSRIPTPATIEARARRLAADARSGEEAARRRAEPVPPRLNSPAALEGYLGLSGALGKGACRPDP